MLHTHNIKRTFAVTDVTNSAATSVNSGNRIAVDGILISEQGGAAEVVIFRRPSAGAEYFRLRAASSTDTFWPICFNFAEGVEVITADAANVDVTFFAEGV